jgi:ribonuclease HI
VTIHGDSNLVINQLNGRWRIRKGLYLAIAIETKELLAYLRGLEWQINFCWIPREQNKECDALSKKSCLVMDESAQQEGTDMSTSNPCRPESAGDHARLVAQMA